MSADGAQVRIVIESARPVDCSTEGMSPGEVVSAEAGRLLVASGSGCVEIERVRPAGKRSMETSEFLRGNPMSRGDRFGT